MLKVELKKIHLIDPDNRYYLLHYYMSDGLKIETDWTVLYDSLFSELIAHEYRGAEEGQNGKLFIDLEGHPIYRGMINNYKNDRIFFNYLEHVGKEKLIKEIQKTLVDIQL